MNISKMLDCPETGELIKKVMGTEDLPNLDGGELSTYYDINVIKIPIQSIDVPTNCKTISELFVALDDKGNLSSVALTEASVTEKGYQSMVKLAAPGMEDEVVEVPVIVDREFRFLDNSALADVLIGDNVKSTKECVKCCLEEAGIKIGLAAILCLISALIFAAATGGLGAPVIVACLGAAATVGVNLALLSRCIKKCGSLTA